ncbi:hypothetical protein MBLNU230_g7333t1 [Neophaeotheca triangularis]
MHSFTLPAATLAAIAAIPAVSAHGYVSGIVSGGEWYPGTSPGWFYYPEDQVPQTAGWYAENQDNGFVDAESYDNQDITCHKNATPGQAYIPVTAGEPIDLQWTDWPESHHGPVISQLARCNGDCRTVSPANLDFFTIDRAGLLEQEPIPGNWASDKLIANNNTWTLTVPADLAPGNFVLRHEIIALHSAGTEGGAQNYPMCINIKVSGDGGKWPCNNGADCRHGPEMYKPEDEGITVNIYSALDYKIPGAAVWGSFASAAKRAVAFIA